MSKSDHPDGRVGGHCFQRGAFRVRLYRGQTRPGRGGTRLEGHQTAPAIHGLSAGRSPGTPEKACVRFLFRKKGLATIRPSALKYPHAGWRSCQNRPFPPLWGAADETRKVLPVCPPLSAQRERPPRTYIGHSHTSQMEIPHKSLDDKMHIQTRLREDYQRQLNRLCALVARLSRVEASVSSTPPAIPISKQAFGGFLILARTEEEVRSFILAHPEAAKQFVKDAARHLAIEAPYPPDQMRALDEENHPFHVLGWIGGGDTKQLA